MDWQRGDEAGPAAPSIDKDGPEEAAEKRKASVRAKVEHPFLYVKRHFGYGKVRYRGLAKNTQRSAHVAGLRQSVDRRALRGSVTGRRCARLR